MTNDRPLVTENERARKGLAGFTRRYAASDPVVFWEQKILHLFLIFILTSALVFVFGNLFIGKPDVLLTALPVFGACVELAFAFLFFTVVFQNPLVGILIAHGLLLGTTYLWRPVFVTALVLSAIFGIFLLIKRLRISHCELLWHLLAASPAALLILACAGTPFDVMDDLQTGSYHMDLPFHASIAAMIKNYGVTSTGLHGLVTTPYHVFSHALMAGLSVVAHVPVLVVYGTAHWLFFVPFLFFAIAYNCAWVSSPKTVSTPKVWMLISGAFFFIAHMQLPIALRGNAADGFKARESADIFTHGLFFLGSESYVLSVGLFLLSSSLLLRSTLQHRDVLMVIISSAALAWAKASTGSIFAFLWFSKFLVSRDPKPKYNLLSAACATVTVAAVATHSAMSVTRAGGVGIDWFSHIRRYGYFGEQMLHGLYLPDGEFVGSRALIYTVLALLIFTVQFFVVPIAVTVLLSRRQSRLSNVHAIYVGSTLSAGILTVLLLRFSEGNAFWFFNLATLASLPYVLIVLNAKTQNLIHTPRQKRAAFVTIASGCCFFSVCALNLSTSKPEPSEKHQTELAVDWIRRMTTIRDVTPKNIVMESDALGVQAVPVPHCLSRPFLYPAISERPWLNVISAADNCHYQYYLFPAYGMSDQNQYPTVEPVLLPGMTIHSP